MSLAGILAAIVATAVILYALRTDVECNHRMYAHIDEATGRVFRACRCGERFQRSP